MPGSERSVGPMWGGALSSPLPLCPAWTPLPLPTCVWLGQPLVSPLEWSGALESGWPGFKSCIMLLTAWDLNSLNLNVLVWKITPTSRSFWLPVVACKASDEGSYYSINKSLGTNGSGLAVVGSLQHLPIKILWWEDRRSVI